MDLAQPSRKRGAPVDPADNHRLAVVRAQRARLIGQLWVARRFAIIVALGARHALQDRLGFRVVILDATGRECPSDEGGEIAIDTEKSPLHWFERYYSESEGASVRYRFGRRYYLTGDLGRMDTEGNVHYLGTKVDAISSSDYLIVPSQIEAALISHPAVAEAAIVGKPDRLRGEVIKAFVVLKSGLKSSPAVAEEIAQHVRGHLPPYSLPPEIEFTAELPRTLGGKLYRRTLTGRRPGSAADLK